MHDITDTDGLDPSELARFAAMALAEDLGEGGDVTSRVTIAPGATLVASVVSRDAMVLAGSSAAIAVFRALDPDVRVESQADDGEKVDCETTVLRLTGNARALLAAERSALNILQHLSGIATLTRTYVEAIAGTGCTLLDTRKTTPGLRTLEKYAVRVGGGTNHRMRLDDGILIKDNHVSLCGGVAEAVRAAKAAHTGLQVQVEVDYIEQIEPALTAGADRLLCDNMGPGNLRQAVALVGGRVPIEASGGVRLETIR